MLMGMLSHDLRSPLNAIVMGSAQLMKAGTLPENDARTVARIARSADRMTRMIEQLLDLTRIRLGGGLVLNRQRMDMNQVAEEVVDELRIAHGDREIKILLSPGDTAMGHWDRDRVAQLLSNLISNAVQYSRPQTAVVATVCRQDAHMCIDVHNDGPPIAPEVLPVLCDPFRRGRTGQHGLGLGLYITKQIVEAHGGSMNVESSVAGTTFHIELPDNL
jgi:signal transduction histidine kinase